MGASRIEQLIEDIYEFVESCRMQPLSSTKVIVPKDELYDLLDELRLRTPDEIKRYQKIISNRDAIIADAEEKADAILAEAKEKSKDLTNEHEIMQQAYYQANEMIMQASEEAEKMRREAREESDQIRTGALIYSNDILTEVQKILAAAYESSSSKYDSFIGALKNNLDIISSNKKELSSQLYPQQEQQLY
ncbi:MAG TPA: ATPase, partial [Lachnospiraceae bacterium]|nr:ATPase [Lachnospiraceae bacterium]